MIAMLRSRLFNQTFCQRQGIIWSWIKSMAWSNITTASSSCQLQQELQLQEAECYFPHTFNQCKNRSFTASVSVFDGEFRRECQRLSQYAIGSILGGRHLQTKIHSFLNCVSYMPSSRQFCKTFDKTEVDSKLSHTIEEQKWTHPSSRDESILNKDDELRSILSDMASDFGQSNINNSTEANHTIHGNEKVDESEKKNPPEMPDKERQSKDDQFNTIVHFEEVSKGNDLDVDSENGIKQSSHGNEGPSARNGVLSIDDVVEILREENAKDICVIKVPKHKKYVDYFVIVTGHSTRHLKAMTMYLNKAYKELKKKKHNFMKIEGKVADDWMSIDFGDIVVHFMLKETRELYELEMLWTLGPEFDDQYKRITQYQDTVMQPVQLTQEELIELEGTVSQQEGYSVVIENEREGETVEITRDKRI